jgi:hypothetical protein
MLHAPAKYEGSGAAHLVSDTPANRQAALATLRRELEKVTLIDAPLASRTGRDGA